MATDTPKTVLRFDAGSVSGPIKLDNGYMRVDATLTKVGVFNYLTPQGIRRELRLPTEVFKRDAVGSFETMPLTNEHPKEDGKDVKLTANNTTKFQVGTVSNVHQQDDSLAASVLITDANTIDEATGGKRELSCGYNCDLDMSPGVTSGIQGVPDGLRFDAVQRNIRGNHVALVKKGRAGPEASLRLDADEGIMTDQSVQQNGGAPDNQLPLPVINPTGSPQMKTVKLDGVDFEVSEQAAQALSKVTARVDEATEKFDAMQTELATEKARADKAEEELAEANKLHADAVAPDKVQAMVAARLDLERSAAKVLGEDKTKELKLDEMADMDIRKAVIMHVSPAAESKLADADESYVAARFDQAIEGHKEEPKPNPALQTIRARQAAPTDRNDAEGARQRMLKDNYEAGRQSLKAQA